MEEKLKDLAEQVHALGRTHMLSTGSSGAITNRQNISLELHKKTAELMASRNDSEKLGRLLNEFRGTILLAQATNAIGSKDLEDIMSGLDELESEL